MKRLSLGYDGLLADIYWTRAVQYFGTRHQQQRAQLQSLLAPLLEITTTLDPQLLVAYQFGANFLRSEAAQRRRHARASGRNWWSTAFATILTTGSSITSWASSTTWK